MKSREETEIKLRVRSSRALLRRIKNLGFVPTALRHFERNILFDFKDLGLRQSRCLLRLRFEDLQGVITFKGAPKKSSGYKIRPEIETVVEDGDAARAIFESLGLREAFRYEKYRTKYAQPRRAGRPHGPLLVFDETPIGKFIELEGPVAWIDRVAHALGYDRDDYIAASYGALYREWCLRRGKPLGNMVFRRRKT
jgi:adenylate cyclase, class 2